mmetsp:Transcript_27738/g.42695  ORF Transcript_27738/g.42695 Transcript_27738/m.42695 type:complete len:113 (+) Transcript_27738:1-339(+)
MESLQSDIENVEELEIYTVLQKEGDMLVIPAHWWHQTYALEASVAVASQRCGENDVDRVINHVLTTTGLRTGNEDDPQDRSSLMTGKNAEEKISAMFAMLEDPSCSFDDALP